MSKSKPQKSILKRIKITGRNKLIGRSINKGHFNAKDSGNKTRSKRKENVLSSVIKKTIKKALINIKK
ncbi:MAG: 50S ribosomal protein L35 [bacterium]